jgi:hypothetical protein
MLIVDMRHEHGHSFGLMAFIATTCHAAGDATVAGASMYGGHAPRYPSDGREGHGKGAAILSNILKLYDFLVAKNIAVALAPRSPLGVCGYLCAAVHAAEEAQRPARAP